MKTCRKLTFDEVLSIFGDVEQTNTFFASLNKLRTAVQGKDTLPYGFDIRHEGDQLYVTTLVEDIDKDFR